MRISGRFVGWLLVGVFALVILVAPLPGVAAPLPGKAVPTQRLVHIEASSYEFDPGIIRVNPGDQVTIELVATDVVHGIYIDGYGLQISAEPGRTARLSFTASQPGSFRLRCSETCGALHPFMIGKLQVGGSVLYARAAGLALLLVFSFPWLVQAHEIRPGMA